MWDFCWSIFLGFWGSIKVWFQCETTSLLHKFLSSLLDSKANQAKGFLLEFYIDQNADRAYRQSFEAALMPEVRLLRTLHCLFDAAVFSVSLCTWGTDWALVNVGISHSATWGPTPRERWDSEGICLLCAVWPPFLSLSTDCSSALGSTQVCVRWDVNKKPLIVPRSCCSCLRSASLSLFFLMQAHGHRYTFLPFYCNLSSAADQPSSALV